MNASTVTDARQTPNMYSVPASYEPTELDLLLPEEVNGQWYIKLDMPKHNDLLYTHISKYLLGEYHMESNTLVSFQVCRNSSALTALRRKVPRSELYTHPVTRMLIHFQAYAKLYRISGDIVYTLTRMPNEVHQINTSFATTVDMIKVVATQDYTFLQKQLEVLMPGRSDLPFPLVECMKYFATGETDYVSHGLCIRILELMQKNGITAPSHLDWHPPVPNFITQKNLTFPCKHKLWPYRSFRHLRDSYMMDELPILGHTMEYVAAPVEREIDWTYTIRFSRKGYNEFTSRMCMNAKINETQSVLLLFENKEEMERARTGTHVLAPALTRMECYFRCIIRKRVLGRMLPDAKLFYSY